MKTRKSRTGAAQSTSDKISYLGKSNFAAIVRHLNNDGFNLEDIIKLLKLKTQREKQLVLEYLERTA